MGVVQRLAASRDLPVRVVIRRNSAQRLAGLGYAGITSLWLLMLWGQNGSVPVAATLILGIFSLTGIGISLNRDNLIIDVSAKSVDFITGPPIFGRQERRAFADFDRIELREGGTLQPGADTTGPFARRWCSAILISTSGQTSWRLWSLEGDSIDALRVKAKESVAPLSRLLGLRVDLVN